MSALKARLTSLLRWSERYTRVDMVYVAQTGFWSNANTILVSFASFALYIIFNYYVSKEAYGTYQYLLSLGVLVSALTLTGMNGAVTRAVALGNEGTFRYATLVQLKWSVVPFLAAAAAGTYYLVQGNLTLGLGLFLIGVCVPLNNALNTYGAFLQGKQDFRRGFFYSLYWNVPYYLSVGVVAVVFAQPLLLLAANLVSQSLGLIASYIRTLRAYRPNREIDRDSTRYGGHLSVMGFLGVIAGQADNILAFQLLGPAPLAVYSFATAIPDRIGALFKFLPAAAFPRFAGKAPSEVRSGLARKLLLGTLAASIIAFAYSLIAQPFFAIFFPAYLDAVPYSQLYAVILAATLSGVLANALVAAGNVRMLYAYNIATPLASIGLMVGGIMLGGLTGLIIARILSSVFAFALGFMLYWRVK